MTVTGGPVTVAGTVTLSKELIEGAADSDLRELVHRRLTEIVWLELHATPEERRRRELERAARPPVLRGPNRIVQTEPVAVLAAADEVELLRAAKRCACGHLDLFHPDDSEYGAECSLCDCIHLRTGLSPASTEGRP